MSHVDRHLGGVAGRLPASIALGLPRNSGIPGTHRADYTTKAVAVTSDPSTLKTIGQLSTIGLAFVFALAMGFGAGFWLDTRFGTEPWFSLLGFALGLAAGVLNVVRTMQAVSADERARQREREQAAKEPR